MFLSVFDKHKGCLLPVFQRLTTELLDTELAEAAVAALQLALELCNGLLSYDSVPKLFINNAKLVDESNADFKSSPLRTMCVTPLDLCLYVGWQRKSSNGVGFEGAIASDSHLTGKDCVEVATFQASKELSSSTSQSVNGPANVDGKESLANVPAPATADESVAADIESNSTATKEPQLAHHPLMALEDVIPNVCGSEALIEQLYRNVNELITVLESTLDCTVNFVTDVSDSSCAGLGGGSIKQQYEERLINCSPTDGDEPPEMWLKTPPSQYGDSDAVLDDDSNMVPVSLVQLLKDCAAVDYDLQASVQKVLRGHQAGSSPQKTSPLSKCPTKANSMPMRPGGRPMRPYGEPTYYPTLFVTQNIMIKRSPI